MWTVRKQWSTFSTLKPMTVSADSNSRSMALLSVRHSVQIVRLDSAVVGAGLTFDNEGRDFSSVLSLVCNWRTAEPSLALGA